MGVAPHDHACLIYRTKEEQRAALASYMLEAFARGERFLYIMDQDADTDALAGLQRAGVDIEDALDDGALVVRTTDEMYLADGTFVPERMIGMIREAVEEAVADGFRGLSASGEMTWSLHGAPGSERLFEYESKLNDHFPTLPVSAICQYDARKFSGDAVEDARSTHPIIIESGQLTTNPAFEAAR